jgi:hypothetical protein
MMLGWGDNLTVLGVRINSQKVIRMNWAAAVARMERPAALARTLMVRSAAIDYRLLFARACKAAQRFISSANGSASHKRMPASAIFL